MGGVLVAPQRSSPLYRYLLERRHVALSGRGTMTFCMLNPSVADATIDDPTIRRCVGFARREGCLSLLVVNLFALRSTDPSGLQREPLDPSVLEVNAWENVCERIRAAAKDAPAPLVLGWGADGPRAWRRERVHRRARLFLDLARRYELVPLALGLTESGMPRHPLYAPATAPLRPWSWPAERAGRRSPSSGAARG